MAKKTIPELEPLFLAMSPGLWPYKGCIRRNNKREYSLSFQGVAKPDAATLAMLFDQSQELNVVRMEWWMGFGRIDVIFYIKKPSTQ